MMWRWPLNGVRLASVPIVGGWRTGVMRSSRGSLTGVGTTASSLRARSGPSASATALLTLTTPFTALPSGRASFSSSEKSTLYQATGTPAIRHAGTLM